MDHRYRRAVSGRRAVHSDFEDHWTRERLSGVMKPIIAIIISYVFGELLLNRGDETVDTV